MIVYKLKMRLLTFCYSIFNSGGSINYGILLLLWPTLWGVWLASQGKPSLSILGIFVAGVILMRSAGCIVNDIADRHVDKLVERTKDRQVPARDRSATGINGVGEKPNCIVSRDRPAERSRNDGRRNFEDV